MQWYKNYKNLQTMRAGSDTIFGLAWRVGWYLRGKLICPWTSLGAERNV